MGFDYYAFGALMPGRTWPIQTSPDNTSAGTKPYRYQYNGKESDFEVTNIGGTSYDYGMRDYDPRLGRFKSIDPLTASYPELTPYQYAGNTPIWAFDLDGLEPGVTKPALKEGETDAADIAPVGVQGKDWKYTEGNNYINSAKQREATYFYSSKLGKLNGTSYKYYELLNPPENAIASGETGTGTVSLTQAGSNQPQQVQTQQTQPVLNNAPPVQNQQSQVQQNNIAPQVPPRFNLNIGFNISSNVLANRANARTQLLPLANTLVANPNLRVIITGNVFNPQLVQGNTPAALNQNVFMNGQQVLVRQLMLSRAGTIRMQLRAMGVPSNQIITVPGSVQNTPAGLNTNFRIR